MIMADKSDETDLHKTCIEIEHEREMTKALKISVAEWKLTVAELEKQSTETLDQESEWKTRFLYVIFY